MTGAPPRRKGPPPGLPGAHPTPLHAPPYAPHVDPTRSIVLDRAGEEPPDELLLGPDEALAGAPYPPTAQGDVRNTPLNQLEVAVHPRAPATTAALLGRGRIRPLGWIVVGTLVVLSVGPVLSGYYERAQRERAEPIRMELRPTGVRSAPLGSAPAGGTAAGAQGAHEPPPLTVTLTAEPDLPTTPQKGKDDTNPAEASLAARAAEPAAPQVAPPPLRAHHAEPDESPEDDGSPTARERRHHARAKRLAQRAHRLYRDGRYRSAEEAYRRSLELNPARARTRLGFVAVLLDTGKTEEALEIAQDTVDMRPNSRAARLALGDVYAELGDMGRARETWQEAADLGSRAARRRLAEF